MEINRPESNRIEYKRELNDHLEKEVVAFLNYHEGGILHLGIDKNGKTVGLGDADAVQLVIKDRLKSNIRPLALGLFDVVLEQRDGMDVVKVIVASGTEKPYYLRKYGMSAKGCFIRIGSACEPMPVRMIEDLFARRTRNSLACIRSPRQDLSFEQLNIYYQEVGLTLNDKFAVNLELVTEDGVYNYAAYLLADQNGNSIQVAKYAGTDRVDLLNSKDYGFCCLVKTCKLVLERLEAVENRVVNMITPQERISRPYWNPVALREAVINAIVHNAYETELAPKFEIFSDRMEITSAGSVHPGQEQEDFFAGYSRESYIFSAHFIRSAFPISPEARALEQKVAEMASESTIEKNNNEKLLVNLVDQESGKEVRKNSSGKTVREKQFGKNSSGKRSEKEVGERPPLSF